MIARLNRFSLLLIILSVCLGVARLSAAQDGAAEGSDRQSQIWAGVVRLDGGLSLDLTFAFERDGDGGWTGTVDIPAQGFEGVELGDLSVTDEALGFTIPFPGMPEEFVPSFALELSEDGGSAQGTMTQRGRLFAVEMTKTTREQIDQAEAEHRPQTPRGPFPYRNVEVEVPVAPEDAPTHMLAGTLTLPDAGAFGDGPYPCAVLLTGSGPQDRDETIAGHKPFAVIADALARAGIASLRCDERGIGHSTGDFAAADSYDFANDALAQLDFLMLRPEIDRERVGLIGHSEGGLTASLVAARHPQQVGFIVSIAGMGLTGRETLIGQAAAMLKVSGATEEYISKNRDLQTKYFDLVIADAPQEELAGAMEALVRLQMGPRAMTIAPERLQQIVGQQLAIYGSAWMRTLLVIDPAEFFAQIEQPVLIMNGELDLQVLPDSNIGAITAALEEAGNERVTVKRYPGLNHLFQNAETGSMSEYEQIRETFDEQALRDLVGWVRGVVGG